MLDRPSEILPPVTMIGLLRTHLAALVEAARPHQCIKNLLVLLPLLASHRYGDTALLAKAALAFLALSLVASGTYILNDIFDVAADRQHPKKSQRPFAAGRVPVRAGIVAAAILVAAGLVVSLALPRSATALVLLYVATTLAYSMRLKNVAILDVLVLASLFTLRVLAGGAAVGIFPSFWLLAFSMFAFLSLALVKRTAELQTMRAAGRFDAAGRGYRVDDLPLLSAMGTASGFIAVLIVALYVNSPDVRALYHTPELIWLVCPIALFLMARLWLLAHRGEVSEDPVLFLLKDRVSLVSLALAAVIVAFAR